SDLVRITTSSHRLRLSTERCQPLESRFINRASQGIGFQCSLPHEPLIVQITTNTSLMARFSIDAVFYFMAATAALLTVFAAALGFTVPPPPHHARTFNILAPQATPLAHDLLGPTDGPTSS